MTLVRLFLLGAAVYVFYLVAFPGWSVGRYPVACLAVILLTAFGVMLLRKIIEWNSTMAKIAVELLFILAVALYVGYTMPQKSGRAPLRQWFSGHHPTRKSAAEGLSRLGINPESRPARWALRIFPAR